MAKKLGISDWIDFLRTAGVRNWSWDKEILRRPGIDAFIVEKV